VLSSIAVFFALVLAVSGFADEKRLSVYSGTANYSLTVREKNGTDYVGLLEVLQPLGSVSASSGGRVWRLSFNRVDGEFTPGKSQARVRGQTFDLSANFLLENGRGLVPLSSLPALMQRFLGSPVNFHETSRRLFIGNAAVHFTAQVNKTNPPTLVMNFTSPVNPMIATEPGKLRMVFTREPLVPPGSQTLTFDSSAIPSATFQENNGAAEIAVNGPVPLFASFSNDGRTITITPAPQAAPHAQAPPPAMAAGTPAPQAPPGTAAPAAAPGPVQYFVVVDASHGGEERGAALSDQLAEKDVTLAFALRLRQQLQARPLERGIVVIIQVVEPDHLVPLLQQEHCGVESDEPRGSGHEQLHSLRQTVLPREALSSRVSACWWAASSSSLAFTTTMRMPWEKRSGAAARARLRAVSDSSLSVNVA